MPTRSAGIKKIIRNARRLLRREKRCPHGKCGHRGEQHVRKDSACAVRGCTCPDVGAIVYEIPLTVEVTYLRPNEVHDEGFYHLLSGVLDSGAKYNKKYRFKLMDVSDIKTVRTLRKGK
jgi:uncharacterized protein YfcZ (UPF0381/DUF406 family)